VAGCAHQAGAYRFGADPAGLVPDVNRRAHEAGTLHACDAGLFPGVGAVKPALIAIGAGSS
jgi:choline dehydrogenase-like flavoprotein